MRLALEKTAFHRHTEVNPHDKVPDVLSAFDLLAACPTSWCEHNLLGQALEHDREISA